MSDVRVLQIQIEAPIGDDVLNPVAKAALVEYMDACASGKAGQHQDETFMCANGVKITASHYYRFAVSKD